jgi:nucleoside-diphosphate-sugar epimerase
MVNLFGKGFVGTHYSSTYECIINDRNDLTPKTNNILYTISTTDNYHVRTNPYIDIETNLTTLIRVLENCRGKDIVLNFVSSWFVYGQTDSPFTEDSYCNPKGFYSITKRTAEQLLISYCETFNIKYRILRLANVVGPGDKGVSKKKNALTYLIREIVKNNNIDLYDDGMFYRDYIHVTDVCKAINLIMEKGDVNAIYNIGNGEAILFRDAIDYVLDKTKSTSNVNSIPQAEFHRQVQVKSMSMSNQKLKDLGYIAEYTLPKILDNLILKQY